MQGAACPSGCVGSGIEPFPWQKPGSGLWVAMVCHPSCLPLLWVSHFLSEGFQDFILAGPAFG
jgi:hypothetical protein